MNTSYRERLRRLKVDDLLATYDGLRLAPSPDGSVVLTGELHFHVQGPSHEPIEDTYAIEIRTSDTFPSGLPRAWETKKRIPFDYHKLEGGALCLGAPTEQRMILQASPTLVTFVEKLLIPYLFGFSYFTRYGVMPYDELPHGQEGIRQCIAKLFDARCTGDAKEFLRLASLRKRVANKHQCPCGSGARLGKCHNRSVNRRREQFGRAWFQAEYAAVTKGDIGTKSRHRMLTWQERKSA